VSDVRLYSRVWRVGVDVGVRAGVVECQHIGSLCKNINVIDITGSISQRRQRRIEPRADEVQPCGVRVMPADRETDRQIL